MLLQNQKKGKRVGVLAVLAAVLISGCGLTMTGCGPSGSDEVISWSFYTAYGPEDGACCQVWQDLFKQIEEESDGRLVITTYWSGQHPYEGEDLLRVLEEGNGELAHFYGGYLSSVEPIFALDAMPLMFPADSMEAWQVISGLWGNFEQDPSGVLEQVLQENWNASMVHMMPASPQRFFTIGYEVTDSTSLKGHKLRTYSSEFARLVQDMGGTPVSIAFSEVYTSLATNLIDGLITSVAFAESGGFFDYVDTIGMWEIAQGTDGIMVSRDALAALPDDLRDIFLSVMHDSATKPEMVELELNDRIVEDLVAAGKAKIVEPSEEQRDAMIEIVRASIWEPWLETVGEKGEAALAQIEVLQEN